MTLHLWLIYAVIALVFWGITGVTQKLSTNNISSELSFLWFAYAMIAIAVVLAFTGTVQWRISLGMFTLAAVGGLFNGAGALTSFAALERGGKASIVIPLIALYPLITIAIAMVFLHEHLTRIQVLGVVLALVSAVLLAREAPQPANA